MGSKVKTPKQRKNVITLNVDYERRTHSFTLFNRIFDREKYGGDIFTKDTPWARIKGLCHLVTLAEQRRGIVTGPELTPGYEASSDTASRAVNRSLFSPVNVVFRMLSEEVDMFELEGETAKQLIALLWLGKLPAAVRLARYYGITFEVLDLLQKAHENGLKEDDEAELQAESDRMATQQRYHEAATLLLYCRSKRVVDNAVLMLLHKHIYCDAALLARLRRFDDDPVTQEVLRKWALSLAHRGKPADAAKCQVFLGDHRAAMETLMESPSVKNDLNLHLMACRLWRLAVHDVQQTTIGASEIMKLKAMNEQVAGKAFLSALCSCRWSVAHKLIDAMDLSPSYQCLASCYEVLINRLRRTTFSECNLSARSSLVFSPPGCDSSAEIVSIANSDTFLWLLCEYWLTTHGIQEGEDRNGATKATMKLLARVCEEHTFASDQVTTKSVFFAAMSITEALLTLIGTTDGQHTGDVVAQAASLFSGTTDGVFNENLKNDLIDIVKGGVLHMEDGLEPDCGELQKRLSLACQMAIGLQESAEGAHGEATPADDADNDDGFEEDNMLPAHEVLQLSLVAEKLEKVAAFAKHNERSTTDEVLTANGDSVDKDDGVATVTAVRNDEAEIGHHVSDDNQFLGIIVKKLDDANMNTEANTPPVDSDVAIAQPNVESEKPTTAEAEPLAPKLQYEGEKQMQPSKLDNKEVETKDEPTAKVAEMVKSFEKKSQKVTKKEIPLQKSKKNGDATLSAAGVVGDGELAAAGDGDVKVQRLTKMVDMPPGNEVELAAALQKLKKKSKQKQH